MSYLDDWAAGIAHEEQKKVKAGIAKALQPKPTRGESLLFSIFEIGLAIITGFGGWLLATIVVTWVLG